MEAAMGPVQGPPEWLDTSTAIRVQFVFWLPRPKSNRLRWPSKKGRDVDKLVRAVMDQITRSGIWADDSQVCDLRAVKRWAEIKGQPVPTGVRIVIEAISEGE